MDKRTCTMPGCDKPYRARGLCATHYNQAHAPNRHKHVVTCHQCGTVCTKDRTNKFSKRFCSFECRSEHARIKRIAPVLWVKPVVIVHQPTVQEPSNTWTAGICRVCSEPYVSRWWLDATCSKRCAGNKARADKREHRHRRRARQRDAYRAPVFSLKIYERDGWICKLCDTPVSRDLVAPHPLAPTLDHILALANGGTHEPRNVRLAHFLCNARQGARSGVSHSRPTHPHDPLTPKSNVPPGSGTATPAKSMVLVESRSH